MIGNLVCVEAHVRQLMAVTVWFVFCFRYSYFYFLCA